MSSPVALAARRALAAASHSSHEGEAKTWKIQTIVVAFPGVCMANAFMKAQENSHEHPEFVPYCASAPRNVLGAMGTTRCSTTLTQTLFLKARRDKSADHYYY